MVPKVGLEPTRAIAQKFLRLPRLPFRHIGIVGTVYTVLLLVVKELFDEPKH